MNYMGCGGPAWARTSGHGIICNILLADHDHIAEEIIYLLSGYIIRRGKNEYARIWTSPSLVDITWLPLDPTAQPPLPIPSRWRSRYAPVISGLMITTDVFS